MTIVLFDKVVSKIPKYPSSAREIVAKPLKTQ
jgi:hypothetical protein